MNVIERDTEPSYFYTWPHFIRGKSFAYIRGPILFLESKNKATWTYVIRHQRSNK